MITIGIIGVVAALTMPVLVQNSQKKEVSVRLKKFYSTFSQAIIKSELDNGMKDDWFRTGNLVDDDEDTQASMNYDEMAAFWNKYFAPYIKTLRTDRTHGEGSDVMNLFEVYLADGTTLMLWNGGCIDIILDTNADKAPNKFGADRFYLLFCNKKSEQLRYFGQYIDLGTNGMAEATSRDKALSMCKDDPKTCSTLLIKYDNYEFKDDYPY